MKLLLILLVAVVMGLLTAWEVLWRFEHPIPGAVATSQEGVYVAQPRSMPEGSELPYGQGVFVRHEYMPLWATSKLVFAAYCKPGMHLNWFGPKQLVVTCGVAEGSVLKLPHPSGITVRHDSDS